MALVGARNDRRIDGRAERRIFGRESCVRLNNLDAARTMLLDLEQQMQLSEVAALERVARDQSSLAGLGVCDDFHLHQSDAEQNARGAGVDSARRVCDRQHS